MEVKKATAYREQVEKIEQRGCCIENVDDAIRCLESINYYRLSAYFHAHKYSPVGYLDASIYSRSHKHQKFLDTFNREVEHRKDERSLWAAFLAFLPSIKALFEKYSSAIQLKHISFPEDWAEKAVAKEK